MEPKESRRRPSGNGGDFKKTSGSCAGRSPGESEQAHIEFEAIFRNSPDAIAYADPNRRLKRVNRAFTSLFGYSEEECLGKTTEFLYARTEGFLQTGRNHYNVASRTDGDVYVIEYRRKDGSTFPGETTGVHVRDSSGESLGFMGVVRDLTDEIAREEERQAVLDELRRSQKILEETERIARIGGGELDFRTGMTRRSEGLRRLYGLEGDETLDLEEALQLLEPEDIERIRGSLASGHAFEMEMPMKNLRGEEMWVRVIARPVYEEGESVGLRGFVQDITTQKLAERSTREFISLVSHELRTPLTSILASLDMISSGMAGELPTKSSELFAIALRNSKRLAALVDDILDVEKIEAGKMKLNILPIDPAKVIDEVLELHENYAAAHQIRLEARSQRLPTRVYADPERLQQVLTNLISNAVKVSSPGQIVEIGVDELNDKWVRIAVIDYGPGIPQEFQEVLFEKFTQAETPLSKPKQGTGLGMSIVKGLTERMGGRVDFESAEGQGTKMYIDLPAAKAKNNVSPDSRARFRGAH